MTSFSHDRPRIDEIDRQSDVLDRCLQAIRKNDATIEDCVQQYPDFSELGMLLRSVLDLQEIPRDRLSAQARSDIRQRVLAHYDAQPNQKPVRSQSRNRRFWLRPAIAL